MFKKLTKWLGFEDEAASEARIAQEYRLMPDLHLRQINPSALTPTGLRIYREEVERRKKQAKTESKPQK